MTEIEAQIGSLISIGFLLLLVFWALRDYQIDATRQRLFKLRDELFDKARAGEIDFNSPAYGAMRCALNRSIRFTHRTNITFITLILAKAIYDGESLESSFSKHMDKHSKNLDEEQKKLIDETKKQMDFINVRHAINASPIFAFGVLAPIGLISQIADHMKKYLDLFDGVTLTSQNQRKTC